jgi:uncharacterized protein
VINAPSTCINAGTDSDVARCYELGFSAGRALADRVEDREGPEAMKWYRLAADQGSPEAQYDIGILFSFGYGVPRNDAEAVKWFQLAADQGNLNGQYALGNSYALGEGVPQNYIYAYMWLSLVAAVNSDIKAINSRDYVAAKMTPDQIAEAQRMAREWQPSK